MLTTHVCTKNLKISTTLVIFDPFLAKVAAAENTHFGPKTRRPHTIRPFYSSAGDKEKYLLHQFSIFPKMTIIRLQMGKLDDSWDIRSDYLANCLATA